MSIRRNEFAPRVSTILAIGLLALVCTAATGCRKSDVPQEWTVDKKNALPPETEILAQGTGNVLSTTAPDSGEMYLRDATTGELVCTFGMAKGDDFTFSPADGMVTFAGRTPIKIKVDGSHKFEVLFKHKVHF